MKTLDLLVQNLRDCLLMDYPLTIEFKLNSWHIFPQEYSLLNFLNQILEQREARDKQPQEQCKDNLVGRDPMIQ